MYSPLSMATPASLKESIAKTTIVRIRKAGGNDHATMQMGSCSARAGSSVFIHTQNVWHVWQVRVQGKVSGIISELGEEGKKVALARIGSRQHVTVLA